MIHCTSACTIEHNGTGLQTPKRLSEEWIQD